MVTLVGIQPDFIDALQALVELDFEAAEAYEAAIKRLENNNFKQQLAEFKSDHERHIKELSTLLRQERQPYPDGPSLKKILTKGKVILANLMGDKAILKAMCSNETDTNTAYERIILHKSMRPEFSDVLQRGLNDEKKHKAWLEQMIHLKSI